MCPHSCTSLILAPHTPAGPLTHHDPVSTEQANAHHLICALPLIIDLLSSPCNCHPPAVATLSTPCSPLAITFLHGWPARRSRTASEGGASSSSWRRTAFLSHLSTPGQSAGPVGPSADPLPQQPSLAATAAVFAPAHLRQQQLQAAQTHPSPVQPPMHRPAQAPKPWLAAALSAPR